MKKVLKILKYARGETLAPLVLKNASIINVYTQSIMQADIAICDDVIVGVGSYHGVEEIDCTGKYIAPGFIDTHVHIESAMVTPEVFSHLAIKHGVTTVVADPHEIANVMGTKGLDFMLENSKNAVIDCYFMLPSCVPAVSFEDNGATLNAKKLKKYLKHPRVFGLGEVMDVGAVINGNRDMLEKVLNAKQVNKNVDGHAPTLSGKDLNAYISMGIKTDHECTTPEEALEKVNLGMYVLLREGSQSKDLRELIKVVNQDNYTRFLYCTDDRHIEDLIEEGSIDNNIRVSIKLGLDPIKAYTIATLNAATCYNLKDRGAIAPGLKADLVIFSDLQKLKIEKVMKNGRFYEESKKHLPVEMKNTMRVKAVTPDMFKVKAKSKYVNVIQVVPKSLITKGVVKEIEVEAGFVKRVKGEEEVLKLAVIERHKNTGKYYVGYLEGLGMTNCTIAQTISHDSHNIIVAGSNDEDMYLATQELIKIGGGIVFVSEGKVLCELSLPIAGIMTADDCTIVCEKVRKLNQLAKEYGVKPGIDPYIALAFMALPVIPDVKLTPRGLFDYNRFDFIDLFVDEK